MTDENNNEVKNTNTQNLNDLAAIAEINSTKKIASTDRNETKYGEFSYEKGIKKIPATDPIQATAIIAEDSPPNNRILGFTLSKMGIDVISCDDGETAWDYLQKHPEQKIDVILSDIMMPKMTGLQLLEKIRGQDQFKNIPFVIVSAVADKDFITQAIQLNVIGYMLKPITFEKVYEKMRAIFPNVHRPPG